MMKLLSTAAIVLALSGPAWAQSQDTANQPDYPFLGDLSDTNWSSDSILGMPVKTADGEEIGQVQGIIFAQNDQVEGIVVDTGEYLGVATRPVVIDWAAIQVVPKDRRLVVDVTKDQLKDAPEYTMAGNWPPEKEAEVPDIAKSQPGVITGEDVEEAEGAGGSDSSGPSD